MRWCRNAILMATPWWMLNFSEENPDGLSSWQPSFTIELAALPIVEGLKNHKNSRREIRWKHGHHRNEYIHGQWCDDVMNLRFGAKTSQTTEKQHDCQKSNNRNMYDTTFLHVYMVIRLNFKLLFWSGWGILDMVPRALSKGCFQWHVVDVLWLDFPAVTCFGVLGFYVWLFKFSVLPGIQGLVGFSVNGSRFCRKMQVSSDSWRSLGFHVEPCWAWVWPNGSSMYPQTLLRLLCLGSLLYGIPFCLLYMYVLTRWGTYV